MILDINQNKIRLFKLVLLNKIKLIHQLLQTKLTIIPNKTNVTNLFKN